jgi:lysine 2,3-aminomutase
LNTHFNHYREITPDSARAVDRLLRAGVPVNNQSVLLRGINDSVEKQLKLCHGLLKTKVRPYYLFPCDEVQGTEHLRTPVETGIKIIEGMRGHTSGLAVPTFAIDLSNGGGKISLQPNYILSETEDGLLLRNYQDKIFYYRNPKGSAPLRRARMTTKPMTLPFASLFTDDTLAQPVRVIEEKIPVRVRNMRRVVKPAGTPFGLFGEETLGSK